ncbi:MAG: metallophosphoesterase, partial [Oscillospiraceae bacterium]|nr:metallophosphoesterase [Oscillospiraceae bacterium]
EVDLETLKWDNLADAYCHALLRLEYYYPDTEIIAMLPTYTKSYYSNDKLAQGNALLKEICEHYGVKYIDLRDCGISVEDLPDGIHPDAKGMDYITDTVIGILLDECETKAGENIVYSVTHNLENAKAEKHYYKGASAGKAFTETISGENLSVSVTMGGKDITAEVYEDGKIIIASVNGDIVINAKGEKEPVYAKYIQDLPEDYYEKNLWKIFEHYEEYYTASGWGIHPSGAVRSVTFEVKEGEKIYASSFEKAGINGTTSTDGIRITFFNEDDVLVSMSADAVYKEFAENGYITVPKNAKAVNVPMCTDSLDRELYVYDSSYEPEFSLGEHLEDLPEKFCAGTNLWTALEPENKYYTGSAWGNISGNSVYSLTISVEENVRIFATSFGKSGENGGSRNGIRITWFGEDGVIESVGPDEVYAEFTVNGYITAPEGTTAVNVPMWNGNESNELYILSAEHEYSSVVTEPTCKEQGFTTYTCGICGESYVGDYVESSGEHKYDDGVCIWCGTSKLGKDWLVPEFAEGDYTMVVLPDTQNMITYHAEHYYNMMRWIADNAEEMNIRGVMHMGDMVNNNNDTEWTICKNGIDIIEAAGIPWMPMMGNHDNSAWFNKYYDYKTFGTEQSWFGGAYYADKLDHTYWFITAGEREYLILSLGWAPSWDVFNWAKGVVEENSDKNVIINCHAYMDKDGTFLSEGDAHCVSAYKPGYPNGDDVWNAFADYENVVLAMGGHISTPDVIKRTDKNGINRDVYSMLIDAQNEDVQNKLGMIAVLTFHEDSDKVDVNWYGTRYDALYGAENQFEITVPHICEHDFEVSEKEATCTEAGGKYYFCKICRGNYTEGETEALGHDYKEIVTEPTCTETGYTELVCERCGHSKMKKSMTDISGRFSWTEGQMIQATSGKVLSDANWMASDYTDISDFDFIEIKTANTATKTSTIGLAFYDANKNYISGVVHTDKSGVYGILIHELEVPENVVYIRSTYYSKNHASYKEEFGEFYCKTEAEEIIPATG